MVISVFAGTMAIAGSVSAAIERGGNGNVVYNVADGDTGEVGDGAIIFQGEDDITIVDSQGNELSPARFQRAAEAGGETLSLPVSQDAETGRYQATGIAAETDSGGTDNGIINLTVDTPRITTFDINNNQTDVNGGTLTSDQTGATALIEYNFEQSENITLTVEDEDGVDVTNTLIADNKLDADQTALNFDADDSATANGTGKNFAPGGDNRTGVGSNGTVAFALDPSGVDEGEYTFIAEGDDDLTFGDAQQTTTVTISTDRQASLNLGQDSATQGENVPFTIDESIEGNFHAVIIEPSDIRQSAGGSIDPNEAEDVFRNVGDTTQVGLLNITSREVSTTATDGDNVTAAFAIVEIDGGNGVGSIESQFLSDTSVTVNLLPAASESSSYSVNDDGILQNTNVASTNAPVTIVNQTVGNSDDDQDLEISEGTVQIDNPSDSYVVGQEIDLNGTTSEGTDGVVVYARDRGAFELVQLDDTVVSNVDADNTFEEEDVNLANADNNRGGNEILSLPGSYRLGVIDAQSARNVDVAAGTATVGPNNNIPVSISVSEFNGGISNSDSLVVTETELESSIVTYNGQIATEDRSNAIDISGRAPGQSQIGVIFVGPRGNVDATTVTVEADDTFSEEDISIGNLNQGTVSAHVLSEARDGSIGDGFNTSVQDFVDFVDRDTGTFGDGPQGQGFTGSADQVRSRILANTVDDTASDDLMDTTTFRLADGLTTIETVTSPVESNGTIELEGQTNRKADDNTIVVELVNQDDTVVASTSTDQWGTNGTYSASVELDGVEPGEYQIESDDGENTDRAPVEVVEQVDEEETPTTATPEPDTPTPTPTATPEPDTPTPTEEPADDTETDTPSTDAGTPGFGIVVALTALIAAALLAVRRTN